MQLQRWCARDEEFLEMLRRRRVAKKSEEFERVGIDGHDAGLVADFSRHNRREVVRCTGERCVVGLARK